jgi:hypothetical protein
MGLTNRQRCFKDDDYSELIQVTSVAHENPEQEKKNRRETLKLLKDESTSLGKGKEKLSNLDQPHHSDNLD